MGPPHTPQLNSVAERYNQTLLDRLKPALKGSPLHNEFWTDAAAHAVWTTNWAPTRTNAGFITPFEIYTGLKPSFRHVQVFGATGHYLIPRTDRGKLDDHARPCLFLGVLPDGNGVLVLATTTREVVKTRDASFDSFITKTTSSSPSSPPSQITRVPLSTSGPPGSDYAFWLDPNPLSQVDPIPSEVLPDPTTPSSHNPFGQPQPRSLVEATAPRRSDRSRQPPFAIWTFKRKRLYSSFTVL